MICACEFKHFTKSYYPHGKLGEKTAFSLYLPSRHVFGMRPEGSSNLLGPCEAGILTGGTYQMRFDFYAFQRQTSPSQSWKKSAGLRLGGSRLWEISYSLPPFPYSLPQSTKNRYLDQLTPSPAQPPGFPQSRFLFPALQKTTPDFQYIFFGFWIDFESLSH